MPAATTMRRKPPSLITSVYSFTLVYFIPIEFRVQKARSVNHSRLSDQLWNSESVQIPYKIFNYSLWAKLTCFPYILQYYLTQMWKDVSDLHLVSRSQTFRVMAEGLE